MDLYKNGFVVSELKNNNCMFNLWPLEDLEEDTRAITLNYEADDKWFCRYNMLQIAPDIEYVNRYVKYCREIGKHVIVLLYETTNTDFIINEEYRIKKTLGYDLLGSVFYSYLKEEGILFKEKMGKMNIVLNENNLFKCLEDVLSYIELRKKARDIGWDLENYWEEIPTKISVLDL